MQTHEAIINLRKALLVLAEDAIFVARNPQINDGELRNHIEHIGIACHSIANVAENRIPRSIADDLANLGSVLRSAALIDDPTSSERSFQTRQAAQGLRALRSCIEDALSAAARVGLTPSNPITFTTPTVTISRRDLERGWTESIIERLDVVLEKLDALKEETQATARPSAQQKSLIIYLDSRMQARVRLARLILVIGDALDLVALTRVVEHIGVLVHDFWVTAKDMLTRISEVVRRKADALRITTKRVVTRVVSLVRTLRQRRTVKSRAHKGKSQQEEADGRQQESSGGTIIAIDGPAASGKGTLAKRIAAHFGLAYLDTGLLYRAVARDVAMLGGAFDDEAAAARAARNLDPETLDDASLRNPGLGEGASIVARIPEVRAAILSYQRAFARSRGGAVLDGRDIGTVVCPDADVKLYVTATPEIRAERRYREKVARGEPASLEAVLEDIHRRDARDAGRAASPMRPAADAFLLDTSNLDIEAAFDTAVGVIARKVGQRGRA